MNAAAVMFLNGVDPIGEPFMSTRSVLVREAWEAVAVRAGQIVKAARATGGD